MLISVAMATYNGAQFLREQLDSVSAQTVQPAELVVSDDGSTDDTIAIVRAFAETVAFPVRIVEKQERLGFADNFLHAAGACRSELIAFCDQDDVWLPTKLKTGLERIEKDGSLLAMHRLLVSTEALEPTGVWDQGIYSDAAFDPLVLDPHITGWGNTMLFRRELLTVISPALRPRQPESPERILSHDTWIYVLAAALGRVSHIMEPLIRYRQHGRNAMGVQHATMRERLLTKFTVPMLRYHEQRLFYDRMAILLGGLAHAADTGFSDAARAAERQFIERRDILATRIKIYESKTIGSRLRAYQMLRVAPRNPPVWVGSYAKDLVLGVGGVHSFLTPFVSRAKSRT